MQNKGKTDKATFGYKKPLYFVDENGLIMPVGHTMFFKLTRIASAVVEEEVSGSGPMRLGVLRHRRAVHERLNEVEPSNPIRQGVEITVSGVLGLAWLLGNEPFQDLRRYGAFAVVGAVKRLTSTPCLSDRPEFAICIRPVTHSMGFFSET